MKTAVKLDVDSVNRLPAGKVQLVDVYLQKLCYIGTPFSGRLMPLFQIFYTSTKVMTS